MDLGKGYNQVAKIAAKWASYSELPGPFSWTLHTQPPCKRAPLLFKMLTTRLLTEIGKTGTGDRPPRPRSLVEPDRHVSNEEIHPCSARSTHRGPVRDASRQEEKPPPQCTSLAQPTHPRFGLKNQDCVCLAAGGDGMSQPLLLRSLLDDAPLGGGKCRKPAVCPLLMRRAGLGGEGEGQVDSDSRTRLSAVSL